MGLTKLNGFLAKHRGIAIDSCVFIYHVEENPDYGPVAKRVFDWLQMPGRSAATSTLTMTEILTQPYRVGNRRLVDNSFLAST